MGVIFLNKRCFSIFEKINLFKRHSLNKYIYFKTLKFFFDLANQKLIQKLFTQKFTNKQIIGKLIKLNNYENLKKRSLR